MDNTNLIFHLFAAFGFLALLFAYVKHPKPNTSLLAYHERFHIRHILFLDTGTVELWSQSIPEHPEFWIDRLSLLFGKPVFLRMDLA